MPQRESDPSHLIKHLYIEESCIDLPYTREILGRAPDTPHTVIADHSYPIIDIPSYPQGLTKGKRHLFLSKNRGKFFKPCPGTKEYNCCNYQVLNIGMNCPMDCVYCILQAYLNNPWLSFFVNVDDLLAELDEAFRAESDRFFRIGTGEFTDSMALDRLTGLSKILVNFMHDKKNGVLELKTKAAVIENLEGLNHGGRTVVSWSLNSPDIMGREEINTASLSQRLQAASLCASWGYKLAFHFDPIIYHPNWREGYLATINQLFKTVPAENIVWISMGALRFLPQLRPIATKRFPGSRFFHEEFIMGLDNKYRYFRPQRVEMYRFLYERLRAHASPDTCIYLCMESDEIWQEAGIAGNPHELPDMLDAAV